MVNEMYLKETTEGHNNSSKQILLNFMILEHVQFNFLFILDYHKHVPTHLIFMIRDLPTWRFYKYFHGGGPKKKGGKERGPCSNCSVTIQ